MRSKAIDAWVDEWEITPGDSLIDKIFEEGIGNAQAMIVVVSDKSVNKPWVREELNAGAVRRINNKSKLIPVVIGDVTDEAIPEILKSIVWERINDINNYDTELDRIVRAIYGHQEKPPIGKPPAYIQHRIDNLLGLTEIDTLVLKLCCEDLIQNGDTLINSVGHQRVFEQTQSIEIGEQDVLESIEILEDKGYLDVTTLWGGSIAMMEVTNRGFKEYAQSYIPNYDDIYRAVALEIVNRDANDVETIAKAIEQPAVVVEHVLNELDSRHLLKVKRYLSEGVVVDAVPPGLKRWLQEQ